MIIQCSLCNTLYQLTMKVRKEIEMKTVKTTKTLKERAIESNKLKTSNDCPEEIRKAIESITNKMNQSKLSQLHPPFMPKTLTRFRHQSFLALKKHYQGKIVENNEVSFKEGIKFLESFIVNFDCEYFDIYLQQIREPYIRKMFNENYEFDKIDFKQINNQYKIRTQTQNLLNSASQWLIQIERAQDLLERIQLYFNIKTPMIIEKAKKQGVQVGGKRTWSQSFFSMVRNVSSFALRKSSKLVQSSFFTAVAPAAAMLTIAIIGGNTLTWKPAMNSNLMLGPLIAITVPYLLDGLASNIERKQYMEVLEEWAVTLEQVADNIAKFNQQLEETILLCVSAQNFIEYAKQKLNLEKYISNLSKNISSLTNFNEEYLQQMRDRTEAYFKKYHQTKEGEWTIVIPEDGSNNQ